MKVYLCGGINALSDSAAKDWREQAKASLKCECLDPMARDYRGIEDANVRAIVEGDKSDIDACQIVLVNALRPSWGTAMEVIYAWERGKAVYSFATAPISPWLRYHSTQMLTDLSAAVAFINAEAQ